MRILREDQAHAAFRLTRELVESIGDDGNVALALLEVARQFTDRPTDAEGWASGVAEYAQQFEPSDATRTAALALAALYLSHEPGHVRGGLLEAIAMRRLQERYSEPQHLLRGNVEISVDDYRPSWPVDAIAFDPEIDAGECLECKFRPDGFDQIKARQVAELIDELPPRGLAVAVVFGESSAVVERKRDKLEGLGIPSGALLIGSDMLDSLPLRRPSPSLIEQSKPR